MRNLIYIALSAYKSYTHTLDVNSSDTQTANTHTHTSTHLDTQARQGTGAEEEVFEKRKVSQEALKELTEDV